MRILGRILSYSRPYWRYILGGLLMTCLGTVTQLVQPLFVGRLFGLMTEENFNYQGRDPLAELNLICGGFMLVMLAGGVVGYLMRYLVDMAGQLAVRDFRNEIFRHLQRMSVPYFDRNNQGDLISRLSNDIQTSTSVYPLLADFGKNLLMVTGAFGLMVYFDWQMTLMVLTLSPLLGITISRIGQKINTVTERIQVRLADLISILHESLGNIKVVKAYTREDLEIARFERKSDENFAAQLKLIQVSSFQLPLTDILCALAIVAIIWFGALRILQGTVTFTAVIQYWMLMIMTSNPINKLADSYARFQVATAAGKRLFEVLDEAPDIADAPDARELPPIQGEIRLEGVGFEYEPGKPILSDLTLTVAPGEVVAIVGPNGAGKTSLVNLIPRFYDPTAGVVRVDGHDIRQVTAHSLRRQVGVVIQESSLFTGTIAENIACGFVASPEQIEQAARLANAHDFITRLPDGYATQVGERGARLSGGQRQRIAIARAMLRDPRILILDEFTSSIDSESEAQITEAIERSMRGRTCLVIAHRLNTIRHANRILVLEGGQVVEEGEHATLLERGGFYSRIYESQLRPPLLLSERRGA